MRGGTGGTVEAQHGPVCKMIGGGVETLKVSTGGPHLYH